VASEEFQCFLNTSEWDFRRSLQITHLWFSEELLKEFWRLLVVAVDKSETVFESLFWICCEASEEFPKTSIKYWSPQRRRRPFSYDLGTNGKLLEECFEVVLSTTLNDFVDETLKFFEIVYETYSKESSSMFWRNILNKVSEWSQKCIENHFKDDSSIFQSIFRIIFLKPLPKSLLRCLWRL
jgi:hypothetical protein